MKFTFLYIILVFNFLSSTAYSSSKTLGVLYSPKSIIAEHQELLAIVSLEECETKEKTPGKVLDYCKVYWEEYPEGSVISSDSLTLITPKLDPGEYSIKAYIHKFKKIDPTKPVQSTFINRDFTVTSLKTRTILNGVPIKPNGKNRVWLSNDEENHHNCIFYGGLPVETTPVKIENGKMFCKVIWENIPTGFELSRPTNPSSLTGNILNIHSKDILDNTFIYHIEANIPYKNIIIFPTVQVNAHMTNIPAPEISHKKLLSGVSNFFYTYSNSGKINIDLKGQNTEELQMIATINVVVNGETSEIYTRQLSPNEVLESIYVPDSFLDVPGQINRLSLSLSYLENQVSNTVKSMDYITLAPNTLRVNIDNLYVDGPSIKLTTNLMYQDEIYTKGNWRVYLAKVTNNLIESTGPRFELLSNLEEQVTPPELTGTSGLTEIEISAKHLSFHRYVVVAELLSTINADNNVYITDRLISKPIAVQSVTKSNFEKDNEIINVAIGEGPLYTVALLDSNDLDNVKNVVWEIESNSFENITVTSESYPYFAFSQAVEPGRKTLKGTIQYKDGDTSPTADVDIFSYQKPQLKILSDKTVNPNSDKFAELLVNGQKLDLSVYTTGWYINGEFHGETSVLPLDFNDLGHYKVEVVVRERNNFDHEGLTTNSVSKMIHVKIIKEDTAL